MQTIKDLCAESVGVSQGETSKAQSDVIVESIRQSLGTETVPVLLSERDVERIGLRSAVSLRRDRCKGTSYLPYLKDPAGRIRYQLSDVVSAIAQGLNMPVCVDQNA